MKIPNLFGLFHLLLHPIDSFNTLFPKPPTDEEVAVARQKRVNGIVRNVAMRDRYS